MMKIDFYEGVIQIPVDRGVNIIVDDEIRADLISYFDSYINQKKKTKCSIYDESNQLVSMKDVSFIHLTSKDDIEGSLEFRQKTILNGELSKFMEMNPEMFQSIDLIRSDLKGMLTDSGMYKFIQIAEIGLNRHLYVNTTNFEISKLIANYSIESDELSETQKKIIILNLLLYLNRSKFNILYLDFDIDDDLVTWIKEVKNDNNMFLISNSSITTLDFTIFDHLIYSNIGTEIETYTFDSKNIKLLSYLFHPIVRKNISYQTQKNQEIMSFFEAENTSFLLNFTTENTEKAFI